MLKKLYKQEWEFIWLTVSVQSNKWGISLKGVGDAHYDIVQAILNLGCNCECKLQILNSDPSQQVY